MRVARTVLVVLAAVLTAGLAGAAGASAASKTLTLETGAGPLAPGAPIVFFSSDMQYTTEAGTDECSNSTLTGVVATNTSKSVSITVGEATFTGETKPGTEECFDTELLGPSNWSSQELPWPLTLTTKGTGKLKGSSKITMTEEKPAAGNGVCVWQASKMLVSFAQVGTTPEPLTMVVAEQPMKNDKKASNPGCPFRGKASWHFAATSGGETVTAHT